MRKKYYSILIIFVTCLFFSCSSEEMFTKKNNQGNSNLKTKYLTGEEARKIAQVLREELNKNNTIPINTKNTSTNQMRLNEGEVDYNSILSVIDSVGIKNYTFKIINHPDDSESIFHNLVLHVDENENRKLFMLKYENENQLLPFNQFQGTISMRGLSDETNPCDEITLDANFNTGTIEPGAGGGDATLPPSIGTGNPPNNGGISGPSNGGGGGLTVSDLPLIYQCNSNNCGFYATSWAVYSTHRNSKNQIFPYTIVIRRPSAPINETNPPTNVSDPCNPGSVGVIGTNDNETPCQKLNKFIFNQSIQQTLRGLKTNSTGQDEQGFYISQVTNNVGASYTSFPLIPPNPNKPHTLDINAGLANGNVKGAMHCHTDPITTDGVPMFSPGDLYSLWKIAIRHNNNGVQKNYAEYTVMLSVGSGHYAIKIKDFNNFDLKIKENFDKFQAELVDKYKESTATASSDTLIKNFLKALNDSNLGSVGLYKATETTTNNISNISEWKEQKLASNGELEEIPCN